MNREPNPEMLILARELRGLSQTELAEISGISQSSLSKYESRLNPIPESELHALGNILQFPVDFFYREGRKRAPEVGSRFHRKRRSVTSEQLKPLDALMNLFRLNLDFLLKSVDVEYANTIPHYTVSAFDGNIEEIAAAVRELWGIPSGPIPNLIEVLEEAFCPIFMYDFGIDGLDEVTQWDDPSPPIMMLNQQAPGDRLRFTVAHALGHMIMHHNTDHEVPEMEKEADQFASAFLMPADDIIADLKPATLEHYGRIKPKWKVSIQALIRRAKDLQVIDETRYSSLMQMISRKGQRKNEPFPIPRERPTLFNNLMQLYETQLDWDQAEIARVLGVTQRDFKQWYYAKPRHLSLVVKPTPPDKDDNNLSNA